MKRATSYIVLFLILVFTGCEQEAEIQSKEFPVVISKPVKNTDPTGVTLIADILDKGKETITDYGFKWGNSRAQFTYSVKNVKNTDDFSLRVSSDLKNNEVYIYRAYIQTPEFLILGNDVEFLSEGSKTPVIENFSPTEGFDGTTVTATGSYFSLNPSRNKVKINEKQAEILYQGNDTIVFKIPESEFIGEAQIKIIAGEDSVISHDKFTVKGPEITDISSLKGYSGEYITISGKNFTKNGKTTEIYFETEKAFLTTVSDSEITAVVPSQPYFSLFEEYPAIIKIVNGLKSAEYDEGYTILPAWDKKTSIAYPIQNEEVFTWNNNAYVLEQFRDVIHIYDPQSDKWREETTASHPAGRYENSLHIVLNDTLYLVGGHWDFNLQKQLWSFNIKNRQWHKKQDLPFEFSNATYFKFRDAVHIITGNGEHWKCNFPEEKYEKLNNFPETFTNSFGYSFLSENKVFMVTYGKTFQYDDTNDTWIEKAENSFSKNYYSAHSFGFNYKDNGYVCDLNYEEKIYRYDIDNDRWIPVSLIPLPLPHHLLVSVFSLEDRLYFIDLNAYNSQMYSYKTD
ncbi:IPT/TIG domain-containing protein [Mariniphaga sp.]|uniref:IPT/TIG domain-containing protein n=1 Tax=Mariniphaga sp. TaxID=1954475 RepID=UPI0035623486